MTLSNYCYIYEVLHKTFLWVHRKVLCVFTVVCETEGPVDLFSVVMHLKETAVVVYVGTMYPEGIASDSSHRCRVRIYLFLKPEEGVYI